MAENVHRIGESAIVELNGHRSVRREPPKNFRLVDDRPHHFARSTVHADRMVGIQTTLYGNPARLPWRTPGTTRGPLRAGAIGVLAKPSL